MAKPEKAEQQHIDESSMDTAKARALVQEEGRRRAQACLEEIQRVLAKHKCRLQFVEIRVNGQARQTLFETVPLEDGNG